MDITRFSFFYCLVFLLFIVVVPVAAVGSDAINTISPSLGYQGTSITTTITGANFTTTMGSVRLEKTGESVISPSIISWSPTQIVCRFVIHEAAQTGSWNLVVVKGYDDTQIIKSNGFTISAPVALTAITPAYALVDDDDAFFTLVGKNFNPDTIAAVYLNNTASDEKIPADDFDIVSSTKIKGTFDLSGTGEGRFEVCVEDLYNTVFCNLSFEVTQTTPTPTPTLTQRPGCSPGSPPVTYGDFTLDCISVDPSGPLPEGTPVTVTYTLSFTGSGDETFPSGNELRMVTDLNDPNWEYTIILDGVETPQPPGTGSVLSVSGWILSYPSSIEESMRVSLKGKTPVMSCPLLVRIQAVDSHNSVMVPFYEYQGDCTAGLVSRALPASVSPGSQLTVRIVPNGSLSTDPGWKVSESIPYGFALIGTTAFHTIQSGPASYQFIQNNRSPFSYTIRAPATEGPYAFHGIFTDAHRRTGTVDGDTIVNVGTAYGNYLNATTGTVERSGAQRAMNDYFHGVLSPQGAGSVLENYFLGG